MGLSFKTIKLHVKARIHSLILVCFLSDKYALSFDRYVCTVLRFKLSMINLSQCMFLMYLDYLFILNKTYFEKRRKKNRAPLHKTIVSLQLMVSLQTMVSAIDFLILIGYRAVLLWQLP